VYADNLYDVFVRIWIRKLQIILVGILSDDKSMVVLERVLADLELTPISRGKKPKSRRKK
jgi:hypothetical protein